MHDTTVVMFDEGLVTIRDDLDHSRIAQELATKGFYTTKKVTLGRVTEYTLMKAGVMAMFPVR
jgi:hypothetical protein